MRLPYGLLRPFLFRLDPEVAHALSLRALRAGLVPGNAASFPRLQTDVAGLRFLNPLGLAAGYDKNARAVRPLLRLGFGFVEAGTVTPRPQQGNPRPRMFRLPREEAVINRLGFNNEGLAAAAGRLQQGRFTRAFSRGVVGLNIGANKDSADRIADYEAGVRGACGVADYLTINISSPNTPGLRALQGKDALSELLARAMAARGGSRTPIFLKVAPDLGDGEVTAIASVVRSSGIAALIVSNTTSRRPIALERIPEAAEEGGLSGRPLMEMATDRLAAFSEELRGEVPLIGVGGVFSADDAYAKILAGAVLVQLYTALIYRGPGLVADILRGLDRHLAADGHDNVAAAVGTGS